MFMPNHVYTVVPQEPTWQTKIVKQRSTTFAKAIVYRAKGQTLSRFRKMAKKAAKGENNG